MECSDRRQPDYKAGPRTAPTQAGLDAALALPERQIVGALLAMPIRPTGPLAETHGAALLSAAHGALIAGRPADARNAFHAAAQLLPEDSRGEYTAANYFSTLARGTRPADPLRALRGSLADALGTTVASPRLLWVVKNNFKEDFERAAQANLRDTLEITIDRAHRAAQFTTHPAIGPMLADTAASRLGELARTDLHHAFQFAHRLTKMPDPAFSKEMAALRDGFARGQARSVALEPWPLLALRRPATGAAGVQIVKR